MTTLAAFKTNVVLAVIRDHEGKPISAEDWSGFAYVRKEGGAYLFSASLKRSIPSPLDPKDVKPSYQRQNVTGFSLHYVEAVTALFGDQCIERVQLVYKFLSAQEIKAQIDRLTGMLDNVYGQEP